jgi:hypothetical protein
VINTLLETTSNVTPDRGVVVVAVVKAWETSERTHDVRVETVGAVEPRGDQIDVRASLLLTGFREIVIEDRETGDVEIVIVCGLADRTKGFGVGVRKVLVDEFDALDREVFVRPFEEREDVNVARLELVVIGVTGTSEFHVFPSSGNETGSARSAAR